MNFDYLKAIPQFHDLYLTCKDVERFAEKEPNIATAAARRAIEYLVKLLYSSLVSPYLDYLSVYDMLTDPVLIQRMKNEKLVDTIHSVRKYGNRAVHNNDVSAEEAKAVLKKLHFIVGEICVFLGCVDTYPTFRENLKQDDTSSPMSELDLELSQTFVAALHAQMAARRAKLLSSVEAGVPVQTSDNVSGDSGANSKNAFRVTAAYLKEELPECSQQVDAAKGTMTFKSNNGRTVTIAVKGGCPQLSTLVNGEIQLLPGIDIVLYTPGFEPGQRIVEQLRVFTREEFLSMWNDLGLIRKKVSSAMMRKYKELYGADYKTDIDRHADVISVQSFNNSGKKSKLVKEACAKKAKLTESGKEFIRAFLT